MPNALANETSPYLLQHQNNPVDWLPWGEAAFERAKKEDKLVFLSVGYSTCHWCHVMERECFEDEKIAVVMNKHFVCVKVDREERPDVDATYMAFVQATTGAGGWPLNVWLTPEGKPVVGGTYFPPDDRHGRPGFPKMCEQIARLWKEDRERMEESAVKVMDHLRQEATGLAVVQGLPGEKVFGDFIDRCESMFDPRWGGWGEAPKFPRPAVPRLLLHLVDRFGGESDEGESCRQMVDRTLRAMAAGGMHDHLAGGFHRYSVDRYWHVPHYEKMLYDQAQLASLYLEAWQLGKDERDRAVAEDVFSYVLREMGGGGTGFHAAEDADSLEEPGSHEKLEGAYWTWTSKQIEAVLEPKEAAVFNAAYGVEEDGNSRPESDPLGELKGRNTLFRAMSDEDLAEKFELSADELVKVRRGAEEKLLAARAMRPKPHRDDKVITAWNGMMIAALARGARVLDRRDLGEAAEAAARFIKEHLWDGSTLWRSWRGKRSGVEGFAADYVFMISALMELNGLEDDRMWLEWAVELQSQLDKRHWDEEMSGYVMRSELAGETLLKMREDYDGAEPAAMNMACVNLLKLEALSENEAYGKRAEAILRAGARSIESQPFSCPVLLEALDLKLRGVVKMQVRGELEPEIAAKLRTKFLPRAVWSREEGPGEIIACEGVMCRPYLP